MSNLFTRTIAILVAMLLLWMGYRWATAGEVDPFDFCVLVGFVMLAVGVFGFSRLWVYFVQGRHVRGQQRLIDRGMVAYESEDYDAALRLFREYQDDPNSDEDWRIQLWIGACLEYQGKYREALDAFERALAVNPNSSDALRFVAYLLASAPREEMRNGERALSLAQEASQIENDADWRAFTIVAAAQAELGQFDDAITTYKKAMSLMPEDEREKRVESLQKLQAGQPLRFPEEDRRKRDTGSAT